MLIRCSENRIVTQPSYGLMRLENRISRLKDLRECALASNIHSFPSATALCYRERLSNSSLIQTRVNNMKPDLTIRIRDISRDAVKRDIVNFFRDNSTNANQRDSPNSWWPFSSEIAKLELSQVYCHSLARQGESQTATLSFQSRELKENALKLVSPSWIIDDDFLEVTVLHSPSIVEYE